MSQGKSARPPSTVTTVTSVVVLPPRSSLLLESAEPVAETRRKRDSKTETMTTFRATKAS